MCLGVPCAFEPVCARQEFQQWLARGWKAAADERAAANALKSAPLAVARPKTPSPTPTMAAAPQADLSARALHDTTDTLFATASALDEIHADGEHEQVSSGGGGGRGAAPTIALRALEVSTRQLVNAAQRAETEARRCEERARVARVQAAQAHVAAVRAETELQRATSTEQSGAADGWRMQQAQRKMIVSRDHRDAQGRGSRPRLMPPPGVAVAAMASLEERGDAAMGRSPLRRTRSASRPLSAAVIMRGAQRKIAPVGAPAVPVFGGYLGPPGKAVPYW